VDKLDNLPKISREKAGTVHRCPACSTHLRRLGHFSPKGLGNDDPEANRITEHGYACQNHKCDRKVLRQYDRDGIAAFEVHPDPHPMAVTRTESLMKIYEEKDLILNPVPVVKIIPKTITPDLADGDRL